MKKLLSLMILQAFCVNVFALEAGSRNELADAIRVTPPAPKFTDAERQAELAARRKKVFDAMSDKSMLILFSADAKLYANDVNYVYRQENNLYYLTNLKQNNATLVLIKDGANEREILFIPKRNPQTETWSGKMYSNEEATRISGLKTIVESAEVNNFLQSIKDKKSFAAQNGGFTNSFIPETIYLLKGNSREYRKENEFADAAAGYKIENASPIFGALRLIKSPYEIKLLQHAIDITTEAQMRSMATVGKAKTEYEVQAEVEYTFRRRNADFWGYPSIVGSGQNTTTLHYEDPQGEVKSGDLMLTDVGAEYDHYTADVTRTYPVNGKFSPAQKDIYQIVYDAQEAAAKKIKPGATFKEVSGAADEVIKNGLAKLGLITAPNATYQAVFQGKTVEMPQFKMWFMHGFGHWLGMNVHDVGEYSTPLKAGMAFTSEPGIYLRGDALDYIADTPANKEFLAKVRPAFEKYKNIGVRIEDDMLVTDTGVEWMTKNLPRSISDIESFMAKASKEMNAAGLPAKSKPKFAVSDFENSLTHNLAWNPFESNNFMNGKAMRSGWISDGNETVSSGLRRSENFGGE